ncbi:MAG: hypothetical protein CM15mP47_3660 [Methanobacteriota archaeon]|nr:MAG: hypothetical protein CM15mP47_3660 [Euryarchaeota archaeon]
MGSIRFDDGLIVKQSEDESIPLLDLANQNNEEKICAILWPGALIKGVLLGWFGEMASKKKSGGSGIQQAAGLIRYFDERGSEHAWKITPFQVYAKCIVGVFFYLVNQRGCFCDMESILNRPFHNNFVL